MKRLVCMILAGLLLVSGVSCAQQPNPETTDTIGAETEIPETEAVLQDDLPEDLDFDGETVVFISQDRAGWTSDEITVKGHNGAILNDAVYERELLVEDRLGIDIQNVQINTNSLTETIEKVNITVQSGTHEYDVCATNSFYSANYSLTGIFADLKQLYYLDTSKEYWSQGFNDAVEYKDKQYMITGAAALSMYRYAFVTMFNKGMFDDVGQAYLYEYVNRNEWTLDKQLELIPLFYADENGDGKNNEGDKHGFETSKLISVDPYWSSCNVSILGKDEDGEYQYVFDSGKLHDVAEKVLSLYYGSDGSYAYSYEQDDGEQERISQSFAGNKAAMVTLRVVEMESEYIRGMESDFGVVPIPKFSVEQPYYGTALHDQFTVFTVPTTIQEDRKDLVGATLEAFASESQRSVTPAYYELALGSQYVRDPESRQMLDIIYKHVYIDAGIVYSIALDHFHSTFRSIISSGNNTVISDYKSKDGKTQKFLRTLSRTLDKLE